MTRVRPAIPILLAGLVLLAARPAGAQGFDPMAAPVHVPGEPVLDVLGIDAGIAIGDDGSWSVALKARAVGTGAGRDTLRWQVDGVVLDSIRITGPDSVRAVILEAASAVAFSPSPSPADTFEIGMWYRVPVGAALRASSDGPCCTWTWSTRTGGESWLPVDPSDRFTAVLRFTGAPVLAGGRAMPTPGGTTFVFDAPVAPGHLLAVTGALPRARASGRFVYHAPADRAGLVPAFARTFENAWDHLEAVTGIAPPVDTVRIAFVEVGADREEVGAGLALVDPSRLAGARTRAWNDPDFAAALVAARFWSGLVVQAAGWTDQWLTEALAHFLAAGYLERVRGEGAAWTAWAGLREAYLAEAERYRRPLVWDRWRHPSDLVDAHAAARGAWFLRLLEGELGAETFRAGLRRFVREAASGTVYTEDLQAALEAASGRPLGSRFDAWVHGAGHPVIDLSSRFDLAAASLTVRIDQRQTGTLVPSAFPAATELAWRTLAGEGTQPVTLEQPRSEIRLEMPLEPRYLALDPGGRLLATVGTELGLSEWTAVLRYGTLPSRHRAAVTLAAFGEDPALPLALRLSLEQEPEPVVRRALVESAAAVPPSASLESLLRLACEDPDARVRGAGVRLAGAFPERADLAAFVAAVAAGDSVAGVQAAAVETLARMGSPEADYYARAALITPSAGEIIRAAGFRALARLPSTDPSELADLFLEHTGASATPETILAALEALTALEVSARVTRRLLRLLDHPAPRVRQATILRSGSLLDREALEERLAVESDRGVRAALVRRLAGAPAG